jgi:fluoride ion exporter CrcB/FEX
MKAVLLVALGGAVGSVARFKLSGLILSCITRSIGAFRPERSP